MKQLARQAAQLARQLGRVATRGSRASRTARGPARQRGDGRGPVHRDAGGGAGRGRGDRTSRALPAPVVTTVTHLLRHGQTEHTPERRFSGAQRPAAVAHRAGRGRGRRRAREELGIEVVVASPLRRTRETAEVVAAALGLPVEHRRRPGGARLRRPRGPERRRGAARSHPLAVRRFLADVAVAAPGGESVADVAARVARARERDPGASTRAARCSWSATSPRSSSSWRPASGPGPRWCTGCSSRRRRCSTVSWSSDGRTSVRLVNDTAHLR